MSNEGYRDTPEWQAVEVAVANLVAATPPSASDPMMAADFAITVYEVPRDPQGDRDSHEALLGGYAHFATARMPHVNQGLYAQGMGYWDNFGEPQD